MAERSKFMDTALMQEGETLAGFRVDAAALVRKSAVDDIEADIFLEMLGISGAA